MRTAFYKGLALWGDFTDWTSSCARSQAEDFVGHRQVYGDAIGTSPNFRRSLTVRTYIGPIRSTDHPASLHPEAWLNIGLAQMEQALIGASTTSGPLCYCQDHKQKADVSAGQTAGPSQVVSHGAAGGGWVPAVGELVLFRNPTTGAGFTSSIQAVGAGTVTVALDEDVTTAWDMVFVQVVYPSCWYDDLSPGSPEVDAGDVWRPGAEYRFRNYKGATTATSIHDVDHEPRDPA